MIIGSVTSAPNIYARRIQNDTTYVAPVTRIENDYPQEDPSDYLTNSDRALLNHLQSGVVDVDAAAGSPVAVLAREIARARATGTVPPERPLSEQELSTLVQQALAMGVRPVTPQIHARLSALTDKRTSVRLDVVL
ncbi:hypothetical protein [Kineococcus glutinatus]|uniref:Uncharacterized protein n=1 Tax=Kineococcus glutinatus TaxID=1070872 RepID=A0ABP9HEJ4_9ACTN